MKALFDGRLLVCGFFSTVNGVWRNGVARLKANGALDEGFDAGHELSGFVRGLALLPDGRILVRGFFSCLMDSIIQNLARLASTGGLDTTFWPQFETFGFVNQMAVQPDGGLLLGGSFDNIDGITRYGFTRLHPDGRLDESFQLRFGEAGDASHLQDTDTLSLDSDGSILVAGRFTDGGWMTI